MADPIGDQLLRLARDRSISGRTVLTETITELFRDDASPLTDRERTLVFDILHKVVLDAEMAVRRRLSERLAERQDVPRDLIRLLANDAIEVAYPVLSKSRALNDADLIAVIRQRSREHQLCVALRFRLEEEVSAELAQTGEPSVITTLLANPNARISAETLAFLVEESRRVDELQEPLLRRPELTLALARRMYLWVTAALRGVIVERFQIDPATIDDALEAAAYEGIEEDQKSRHTPASDRLANSLADSGMITSTTLINALAQGQVSLFLAMLARKTGLRPDLTKRLVFAADREGFAVTCRAIGIDRATFIKLHGLCRSGQTAATAASDAAALRAYDRTSRAESQKMVRSWQRDPEFLAAIADVLPDIARHAAS